VRAAVRKTLVSMAPAVELPDTVAMKLTDYVLGQQDPRGEEATRYRLTVDERARRWVSEVAARLGPLSEAATARIPATGEQVRAPDRGEAPTGPTLDRRATLLVRYLADVEGEEAAAGAVSEATLEAERDGWPEISWEAIADASALGRERGADIVEALLAREEAEVEEADHALAHSAHVGILAVELLTVDGEPVDSINATEGAILRTTLRTLEDGLTMRFRILLEIQGGPMTRLALEPQVAPDAAVYTVEALLPAEALVEGDYSARVTARTMRPFSKEVADLPDALRFEVYSPFVDDADEPTDDDEDRLAPEVDWRFERRKLSSLDV
jgi:hypothetical protein